jgi:hypothetical protein
MFTADHDNRTSTGPALAPTRRRAVFGTAAIAGILAAPRLAGAAPGADAELIATHAAFMASHARIKWGEPHSGLTDDDLALEIGDWYAALERATELSPVTAEGRRARLEIAYAAMMSTRDEHQREEACAMSVLADLLGSAA